MRTAIWLLLLQASLGAFDTLYYHEYRLQLAHGVHTRVELRLHGSRDFAYAIIIGSLGFVTWRGALAWGLLGLLLAEICITLWDFIEEDKIRRLPAGERAMHAIMGIVYGAFLAFLIPEMLSSSWTVHSRPARASRRGSTSRCTSSPRSVVRPWRRASPRTWWCTCGAPRATPSCRHSTCTAATSTRRYTGSRTRSSPSRSATGTWRRGPAVGTLPRGTTCGGSSATPAARRCTTVG